MLKRCLFIIAVLLLLFLQTAVFHTTYADTDAAGQPEPVVLTTEQGGDTPTSGWAVDADVTEIGKSAARAGLILDWTLSNYQWACVNKVGIGQCDNNNNPLQAYSKLIAFYIVLPVLFTMILISAGVIIVTRGTNLTIKRFIPLFVGVILLIVFSFPVLKALYELVDFLQGIFLGSIPGKICPPACITQRDLLYVGWNYKTFIGLKLLGNYHAESVDTSLWLIKLTTWTYSAMIFLLLMRKIILWFFIIISPIFPLLLLFGPTRGTAKVWVSEFFRWLLYAPIFSIFLQGLVFLWQNKIPLWFSSPYIGNAKEVIFPTAINIMMAGPRQTATATNSLNLPETFILYVVALLMIWVAIILPWILLQVILRSASNFSAGDSAMMKTLINFATTNKSSSPSIIPGVNTPISPKGPGSAPSPEGAAIRFPALSFAKKFKTSDTMNEIGQNLTTGKNQQTNNSHESQSKFTKPINLPQAQVRVQALSLAQVPLPSMRDIAKYDTALMTKQAQAFAKFHGKPPESKQSDIIAQNKELMRVRDTLMKIANPDKATSPLEHDRYVKLRDRLEKESQQGNLVASSIMNAVKTISPESKPASPTEVKNILSQIANPASATSTAAKETMTALHETLSKESTQNNNELARAILGVNANTSDVEIANITNKLHEAQSQNSPVASAVFSTISTVQTENQQTELVKNALSQIANPESIKEPVEKEQVVKVKESLTQASHQGNDLASSILAVNAKTSDIDIKNLQARILELKEKGDPLANAITSSLLSSITNAQLQNQVVSQLKSTFTQLADPSIIKDPAEREQLTKIKDSLTRASREGNDLANDLLSVNEATQPADIEKLMERINTLKEQKDPLATELSTLIEKATQTSLPATNNVQSVNQEDYQAAKSMWKENYLGFELAGNRTDWISDDIARIDQIVALLSSGDDEKINQGLRQISELLPFLLVGGFSLDEIISYLKAKREAAQEALNEIRQEEDQQVPVSTNTTTQNTQQMAAEINETNTKPPTENVITNTMPPEKNPDDPTHNT